MKKFFTFAWARRLNAGNGRTAFTMAEMLITLAIIGIVAALTIPNLIQKYKKVEVETKLKRFYSMANQAIQLSEIENGPKTSWTFFTPECLADSYSEACLVGFWEKYLERYFKYTKTRYYVNSAGKGFLWIYLADGSAVRIGYAGHDYKLVIRKIEQSVVGGDGYIVGVDGFNFGFYPEGASGARNQNFKNKGIEPYIEASWDGDPATLYNHTINYAKIIQLNGWKIPEDYPVKF